MDGLWKLAAPLAALALAAAACGDGGGDDSLSATQSPTPSVLQATETPRSDPTGDGGETCTPTAYEVQSGDTLSQIAVEFDVTVEAIAAASGIDDPNVLSVGQELTIPCPGDEAPGTSPSPAP